MVRTAGLMRVAVVNYASPAGLDSPEELVDRCAALRGWASSLAGRGCTVGVFQGFDRDAEIELDGVGYLIVGGSFAPDLSRRRIPARLHRRVARWRPDVVHFNSLTYPLQLIHLRAVLDGSCAVVVQHHAERPMRGARRVVQRFALRRADAALFNGAAVARPWVEAGLLGGSTPVWSVPEASSDLRPADPAEGRRAVGEGGDPLLLWVGNLDANKDPLTVLDAVSRVSARLPGVRLLMAYRSAPLLQRVRERIAAEPDLVRRITLLGSRPHDEIGRLMTAADLLVQASRREGSGFAVIDALACGLPPVVTDIPSFRYLTDDGRIGALFRPGDADELADTLFRVVESGNPSRGAPALAWFRRKLAWPAVACRGVAAYRLARCRRSATRQRASIWS
jgi:glycosyltransferase involved in cell wall biosynthesis